MIEVVTVNGFRRMINPNYIVTFNEISNRARSNTAITLTNGETVFVDDAYDSVKAMLEYEKIKESREQQNNPFTHGNE